MRVSTFKRKATIQPHDQGFRQVYGASSRTKSKVQSRVDKSGFDSFDSSDTEELSKFQIMLEQRLRQQKDRLEVFHKAELKNIQFQAKLDAREFVQRSSADIIKAVSSEYTNLVKQHLRFREKTWTVIDKLNDYG